MEPFKGGVCKKSFKKKTFNIYWNDQQNVKRQQFRCYDDYVLCCRDFYWRKPTNQLAAVGPKAPVLAV